MFNLPAIPVWEGFHPLVVHFPIALLISAPLLIVLGLIWKSRQQSFFIASFVLMLLGTLATFIAVATGQAAGEIALRNEEINKVIELHSNLATTTRNMFSAISILFLFILLLPKILKREIKPAINLLIIALFMVIYFIGIISIANTAHQGGILVHQLGVKSII